MEGEDGIAVGCAESAIGEDATVNQLKYCPLHEFGFYLCSPPSIVSLIRFNEHRTYNGIMLRNQVAILTT
jgi:hypothetical protein